MPRHLEVTTRAVPESLRPAYDAAWQMLAVAAKAAGVNAWRFRSADSATRFLEFLEWASDDRVGDATVPTADPGRLRAALDEKFGAAEATQWQEVPTP